jgi:hypothetical protein
MLHQVKSAVTPVIVMTLIVGTTVLLRLGLALHALR